MAKGSANIYPHVFLLLQSSHLPAAEASAVRIYWKDGSMYARDEAGVTVLVGPGAAIAGSENFTDLVDCPTSYTGAAGQFPRVANSEDGLEFYDFDINDYLPAQAGNATRFLRTDGTVASWEFPDVQTVSFTDLTDTPNDYSTAEFESLIRVNLATNGLQFIAADAAIPQNARVGVRKDSTGSTYKRRRLNFIQGSNVTITVSDDNTDEEVDITISATGTSSPTMTRVNSSAYEASRVIKATAGNLRMVYGYNSGPAQFIQLHDSTALPADGVAPASVIAVEATKSFAIAMDANGIPFTNGIVICNSTTGPTKTIGSANCYFTGIFD